MKKTTPTFATALIAVSILASGAFAASASYDNEESAISQIRSQGTAAFEATYSAAQGDGNRTLQRQVDLDNARFQWDTQVTSLACPNSDPDYHALQKAEARRISGVSFIELTIVADRKDNPVPLALVEEFVRDARLTVEPIDSGQIASARLAHLKYGRGRHKARLNLGDCFVYALAKQTGEPLLFKGDDFAHTDLRSAL